MTSYTLLNESVMWSQEEGFPLLMPRWGYVASAFVLFLIGFFGFFLNLMVILLMFKDRQLWTPLNIILFNLVCSDFSVSVLGNPLTLISALFHRWIFGRTMCVVYGFFMALLGITSITTLTVISFERYLMVTRPLSTRHLSSKSAGLAIVFIWTYSLALTTPPLMGWGNYVNEAANISCSVNWHEQSMNTLTYILFLFAMGQIVPLAVIIFSYVNIIKTMKRNSQRLGKVSRAEARATAMVFVMIIAFTVAWTPYSVFALMEQFAAKGIITPGAGVIPALVAKSSICYDPLIYVGMNTQFRQSIRKIFGMNPKKGSHSGNFYNNSGKSRGHKLSTFNEITIRYQTSDSSNLTSMPKKLKERTISTEDSDMSTNDTNRQSNKMVYDLGTIQECKTISDIERSADINGDEYNANNKNKITDNSPILTIDDETLFFNKRKKIIKNTEDDDDNDTLSSNSSDYQLKGSNLKQSYSFELVKIPEVVKMRKYSVETKIESNLSKGFKEKIVRKYLDKNRADV
ncbi:parapinopsin-like [Leptidea sinapis]|uniref:parapinopsin-like n=1 Tax=Leptidea sinapis TaxID=189913 RepID=UPI0021C3B929|nr:parapinopsin-like [Leptidea sinapis]